MTTKTQRYTVSGMSCGHCENAIKQELSGLEGITQIDVSAADGSLTVTLADNASITPDQVIEAVDEAGYEASLL